MFQPPKPDPGGSQIEPTTRDDALATIGAALDRLRFGDIRLTIHDGRIVQLEVTEKKRFTA